MLIKLLSHFLLLFFMKVMVML